MSANQFAFIAESAWTEERYHRCPMDSDPARLRIVGKFVSPAGRVGSIADDVAASRAVARTPCAAYPAYAESVVADLYRACRSMNVQLSQALSDVTGETGQA